MKDRYVVKNWDTLDTCGHLHRTVTGAERCMARYNHAWVIPVRVIGRTVLYSI